MEKMSANNLAVDDCRKSVPTVVNKKPKPKLSMYSFLIIGGIFFLLIIIGWGFVNGYFVKKFALTSEKMMSRSNDWQKSLGGGPSQAKDQLAIVTIESESNLNNLNNTSPPAQSAKLKRDLTEYYRLSDTLAIQAGAVVDWSLKLTEATDVLNVQTQSSATTTKQEMIGAYTQLSDDLGASKSEIEKTQAPKGLEKQQKDFIDLYAKLISFSNKVIVVLKSNDPNSALSLSNDSANIAKGVDSIQSLDKTLGPDYRKEVDRANRLEEAINSEIAVQKKVSFSLLP